jgi:hypothetical protein
MPGCPTARVTPARAEALDRGARSFRGWARRPFGQAPSGPPPGQPPTLTPRRTAGNAFLPPGLPPVLRRKGCGEERGSSTHPVSSSSSPGGCSPSCKNGSRPSQTRSASARARSRRASTPRTRAPPGQTSRVGRGWAAGRVAARPRTPADRQGARPRRQRRPGQRFRRGEPCPPIGPVARTPCHHPAQTSHRNVQTAVPRDPSRAPVRP